MFNVNPFRLPAEVENVYGGVPPEAPIVTEVEKPPPTNPYGKLVVVISKGAGEIERPKDSVCGVAPRVPVSRTLTDTTAVDVVAVVGVPVNNPEFEIASPCVGKDVAVMEYGPVPPETLICLLTGTPTCRLLTIPGTKNKDGPFVWAIAAGKKETAAKKQGKLNFLVT